MSKLDITFCKVILIGGGLIALIAELCLLVDQYQTGYQGLFPAWAKVLIILTALALVVGVLAVKVEE